MKNLIYSSFIMIFFSGACLKAQVEQITNLERGQVVMQPSNFNVAYNIQDFDSDNAHYWMAIASVSNVEPEQINHVLDYTAELKKSWDDDLEAKLHNLLSSWELNNFWPKYYIKNRVGQGDVYEGGNNPLPIHKPMVLLILKVDDRLNNYFISWFNRGELDGYPGISIDNLQDYMIVERCEILLP